jgi:hypothetical protein
MAFNLANFSDALARAGNLTEARQASIECAEYARQTNESFLIGMAEGMLAWLDLEDGDLSGAAAHAVKALGSAGELDDPFETNNMIVLAAGIAFARGDTHLAARLLGAANAGRERAGIAAFPNHAQHARLRDSVTAALGEPAMTAEFDAGYRLAGTEARAIMWSVLRPE